MKDAVDDTRQIGWMVWLSLLFAACAKTTPSIPTPHFLAWSQDHATPKRMCVLPFLDRTHTPGIATQVRQSVAGHLSVKHFTDVELSDIDERLSQVGEEWRNFSPQQVGKTVGCDAMLYGEVTEASRLYLALYSQLTVAASLHLVDATTGQTLAQESYATKFRAAGVPLSPLAIVPDVVKTLANLSETQMTRAIDDLGRNLVEKLPNLPARRLPSQEQFATAAPASPALLTAMPVSGEAFALSARDNQPAAVEIATVSFLPPTVSRAEKPTLSVPPTSGTQRRYRLQVAEFRMYRDAQRVVRLLRNKGYPAMIAQTVEEQQTWNRVVLGPYPSLQEAQQVGASIEKISSLSPVVIRPADR
jgi:cell division septation protein DedD